MKRVVEEELLDLPDQPLQDVFGCLDDLRAINQRMGGNALHADLLRRAAHRCAVKPALDLLEVASGRADVLQHAAFDLQSAGQRVNITLLDQKELHFPNASHWHPRLPEPNRVLGDALSMPFANNSFDVVSSCLFAHHLEPEEFSHFLREALRVTRTAVIINDLERTRLHWLLAHAGRIKFRSRLTINDAPISVRRAYTLPEMRSMLAKENCTYEIHRAPVFRIGAIAWKV